ncbi:MAG: hypothetical protein ABR581_00245 [Thermoleophilaceae bacterium]
MRSRLVALVAALVVIAGGAVAAVALIGGDDGSGGDVAASVERQLAYLDPKSSLVATVDMRFDKRNWRHLRAIASRVLREYRSQAPPEERRQIPLNVSGGLELLARFGGLSFEDDVKPLLDGHFVIGVTFPPRKPLSPRLQRIGRLLADRRYDPGTNAPLPSRVSPTDTRRYYGALRRRNDAAEPRVVGVYRTKSDRLRRVVGQVMEGERPKKARGFDDTLLIDASTALVGKHTLAFAEGGAEDFGPGDRPTPGLRAVLKRAKAGQGYPAQRLAEAQRELGGHDPFVLAAADPTLMRAAADDAGLGNDLLDDADLDRARREVPYLEAIRSLAAVVNLDEDKVTTRVRVNTEASRLRAGDLPLGPAGSLELPDTDLTASASRNQSVTTSFAARVARALFSGSEFVRAVERTERDLGIRFDDEVLRQFDCPSASVFDARNSRFWARSCLRDPARMRKLLPRLRRHLPRIVRALQNLGDQGLLSVLLVAPDAPAIPSLPAAALGVKPLGGEGKGPRRELLYEMSGLHDAVPNPFAAAGPARVVFGMIGDEFVVASDRGLARRLAKLRTRRFGSSAATAIRVPAAQLFANSGGAVEAKVAARIIRELVFRASANRRALDAYGELRLGGL